jgi:hypothetical protein
MSRQKSGEWDREQIARDIRIVNGSPEGQRFIAYLLSFTHVHRDSLIPGKGTDVLLFNEGQRSVGNEIIALLYNEPERFTVTTVTKVADQAEGIDL